MSLNSLEHSNRLINDNRRRIELFRAEMAAESLNGTSAALRLRVLEQMELSLACLERHRDALAMRLGSGSLNTQSA